MSDPESAPLPTSLIHDTVPGARLLPGILRPVTPVASRLQGPAFTVRQNRGSNLWLHRAIEAAPSGSVLVMAGGDRHYGYWGELMTRVAIKRDLAGLVIEGSVRDLYVVEELGFPVFATGVCPRGTSKNPSVPGGLDEAVVIGGVLIRSGDLIVGDRDGLVVVPRRGIGHLQRRVRSGQSRERELREAVTRGESLLDHLSPDQPEPTLLSRLEQLDTCAVSDALDRLGVGGAAGGFRRWGSLSRVAGRVETVTLSPGPAQGGAHLGTRSLSRAEPDSFIVVANAGRTGAGSWGGLLSLQARLRGVRGILVDGLLRDADEVDDIELCLLARGSSPRTARGRFHESAVNVPVEIEGHVVDAGSLVLADGSGVAFIPSEHALQVVETAEEIVAREADMTAALLRGEAGHTVMGAEYETMLRGPGMSGRDG